MEEFVKVLGNYGFPIAVTLFLLVRMEKTIQDLRIEIIELKEKITDLKGDLTISRLREK
jgi:hypothetical protein